MDLKSLDIVFSHYIKIRETNFQGYVTCPYCLQNLPVDESENCHFVKRGNKSVRFDEINCHAGHVECNRIDDQEKYEMFIEDKYGDGTSEELRRKGKITYKFSRFEMKEMIAFYRNKIKELKSQNLINELK